MEELKEEIKPIGWIEDCVISAPHFFWWKALHNKLPKKLRAYFVEKYGIKGSVGISSNIIVNVGKALIAARLGGLTGAALGWVATGTGATTPAAGDTVLEGEAYRQASANTLITTTTTNDTLQATVSIAITGSATIKKAGTFNAASVGTLINAAMLAVARNVSNGDTHSLTVRLKIS